MRVTPKQLRERVSRLHKLGYDIEIGWAYGRSRCANAEARNLSPHEMMTWIEGYEAGIEAERARIKVGKTRKCSKCGSPETLDPNAVCCYDGNLHEFCPKDISNTPDPSYEIEPWTSETARRQKGGTFGS